MSSSSAAGSPPPAPFSPPAAAQDEPNTTLLPPPRAPLTLGNLWAALKMTRLEDFTPTKLAETPCMRQALLQGIYGGTGFAALCLLTGKPGAKTAQSAFGWFTIGFGVVGGAANMYCHQKRTEEIEMMRLVQMRYPERNLVTAGRRAKALHDEEEARLTRGGAPRTAEDPPIVDPLLGQKVDMRPPPKVAVSQPQFVEVHDAQGEFVGRMSPAMAELAKSRGATETFSTVATPSSSSSDAPPPPSPADAGRKRGWLDTLRGR